MYASPDVAREIPESIFKTADFPDPLWPCRTMKIQLSHKYNIYNNFCNKLYVKYFEVSSERCTIPLPNTWKQHTTQPGHSQ